MPTQQPPPQEYGRVVLIIILLFFLYNSPDQGNTLANGFQSPRDIALSRISRARHALNILNSTKYGDFAPVSGIVGGVDRYMNITGFRKGDNYAWERLEGFKKLCERHSEEARGRGGNWGGRETLNGEDGLLGSVYENVTGIAQGSWVRYEEDLSGEQKKGSLNLTEMTPNIDWAYKSPELWQRNITGKGGKLMLRASEKGVEEMDFELGSYEEGDANGHAISVGRIREVAATVVVQDESSSGSGWEARVHGVHWPRQGVLLMTTTSEKFQGIFGLPHLTTSPDHYTTTQRILNKTLEKTIEGMEESVWIDVGNPWSSAPEGQGEDINQPTPHCEFIVYAQVYPLVVDVAPGEYADKMATVEEIEQELRFPNGAPIPSAPRLQMSVVIFSPDCGFMLESKGPPAYPPLEGEHLIGSKQEVWLNGVQHWLQLHAALIFGQVLLLKRQNKEASTPSTVGRVSIYTIAMMLMADAMLFSALSLLSAIEPTIFTSVILTSFSALMSVGLGVRFISSIYTVQEPERRERLRAQLAARHANAPPSRPPPAPASAPAVVITAAGADTLPVASSHPTPPNTNYTPVIVPSDGDVDAEIAENLAAAAPTPLPGLPTVNAATVARTQNLSGSSNFGAVYFKFIGILSLILFSFILIQSWPPTLRAFYINVLAFAYLSFWVPQIRRNVIRNCRKGLLWQFVVGQSLLRLAPFAYFYLREGNVALASTDWKAFCVLAGWVWVQVWVLIGQEVLGPRWGLPKTWYEEGWDYHPILREDNLETGGLPIGLVQIPGSPSLARSSTGASEGGIGDRKKKDSAFRSTDCAICMQVLEVPVIPAGEDKEGKAGGMQGMLERRRYMVTPCRHVFHSQCLEGWMRYRLQCPNCRENLPPL